MDFSSPQSPLGPPSELVAAVEEAVRFRLYSRYPDYSYSELREAIASFYGVDVGRIVPLNGTAEFLGLILPVYKPKKLVVVEPTFGDHEVACRAVGLKVESIALKCLGDRYSFPLDELLEKPKSFYERSIILYSSPNNPTGALVERRVVEELLEFLPDSALLVADEAFIDFVGEAESLLGFDDPRVVVLRSFTKIFAVPGLRLGFAYIGDESLALRVDCYRQPWNVNALAAYAFSKLLKEYEREVREYIGRVRSVIAVEREWLSRMLEGLGVRVYRSSAPFLLVYHPQVRHPVLQERLIGYGVYVRDGSSFKFLTPSHSRVSVRLRRENMVLVEAFRRALGVVDA